MDTLNKPFEAALKLEVKLYKALRPLIVTSQILCVAPVDIFNNEPASVGARNLHFIWCLIVYSCISSSIYTEYTTFNISLPTIQKPLYFSEYLVYLFHVLLLMTACYFKKASFGRCIQTIVAIDCKLMGLGIIPCYKAFTNFFTMHLGLLVVYAGATAVVDFFYSGMETVSFLRSMTVYLVPNLIISMSMTQYYMLLYGICLRCKSLVAALENFHQQYEKDASRPKEAHRILNRVREILSCLLVFVKEVNFEFAVSILSIYFGSFINMSINIFLIYKYVDQRSQINIAWTMYSVIWIGMHLGKMSLILYFNHLVAVEKDKIAMILNDIRPHDDELEIKIKRFILQLLVNLRTHFLCGLVELNMSYVRPLLENTSVLVIFLIQYDVTFEALTNIHSTALTSPI